VLLRLLYPTLTSVFAALPLLPMSDTDTDIEILTLRHQLTILRRHRDLIRRRHADASRRKNPRRPPTRRAIQSLVLRLARENQNWGYRRIHVELTTLGTKVAPSTVRETLKTHGTEPTPQRDHQTRATFLRNQFSPVRRSAPPRVRKSS
jgi:putative transposase